MKTFLLLTLAVTALAADEPLVFEKTIPLPGVRGRFDHFSSDAEGKRLAVAALGNDTVEVFDAGAGARVATLPAQSKPQGVLFVAAPPRLLVANGRDGTLRAFETGKFEPVTKLTGFDDADNVRWDSARGHAVVGFGDGALAVMSAANYKLLGKVTLAAHPEAFQIEKKGARAFVNVPGRKHVAIVDMEKLAVVVTWPLEKWRSNFPMALDEEHGRVFIGCRSPARVVALDTANGRAVAECEIGGDTDDLFFDAKRGRIYVSCGEGFLDTIRIAADGKLTRIAHQPTHSGARTCLFSTMLDRLILAVPGKDAELRIYRPAP